MIIEIRVRNVNHGRSVSHNFYLERRIRICVWKTNSLKNLLENSLTVANVSCVIVDGAHLHNECLTCFDFDLFSNNENFARRLIGIFNNDS